MFLKVLFFVLLFNACAHCDWVKLPDITKASRANKIKTKVSPGASSTWASSDVMSSVFSYDKPKFSVVTTTENILVTGNKLEKPTSSKRYLISTVTSKSIEFIDEISDRVDNDEIESQHVMLASAGNIERSRKVAYMNQTVPMRVVPIFVRGGKKTSLVAQQESEEDDGVTILDDEEILSSSEEAASDEDFYEYEELPTSTTSTTKPPRKQNPTTQKPRRRISQMANTQQKVPSNHLSFGKFLKFVKGIQETFTTRTAKNINDKIRMLRDFRDNLLLSINQRIKNLWKTKSKKTLRVKRTLGGGWMEPSEGMDFPSAEGALLSISFLTFAVFLIKLVLQVIKAVKMKKYSYGMNGDGFQTSNVVIKRAIRDAAWIRDVHFIKEAEACESFYSEPFSASTNF